MSELDVFRHDSSLLARMISNTAVQITAMPPLNTIKEISAGGTVLEELHYTRPYDGTAVSWIIALQIALEIVQCGSVMTRPFVFKILATRVFGNWKYNGHVVFVFVTTTTIRIMFGKLAFYLWYIYKSWKQTSTANNTCPWEILSKSSISNFQTFTKDRYLEHFLWSCPQVNSRRHHWWEVNIVSGNSLVP